MLDAYHEDKESNLIIHFVNSGNTTLDLKRNSVEPLFLRIDGVGAGYWCYQEFPRKMPANKCQLTDETGVLLPSIILEPGEHFSIKYPLLNMNYDGVNIEGKIAGVKDIKHRRLSKPLDETINQRKLYIYSALKYFGYLVAGIFLVAGLLFSLWEQTPMEERRDIFNRMAGKLVKGQEYIYPFEGMYVVRFFNFSKFGEYAASTMKKIYAENNLTDNFHLLKEAWLHELDISPMDKNIILDTWKGSGILDKIEQDPTVLDELISAYAEFEKIKAKDKAKHTRQHQRNGAV